MSLGDYYGTSEDYRRAETAVAAVVQFWHTVGMPEQFKAAVADLQQRWEDLQKRLQWRMSLTPGLAFLSEYADAAQLGREADALRVEIGRATGQVPSGPIAQPEGKWGTVEVWLVLAGVAVGGYMLYRWVGGEKVGTHRRRKRRPALSEAT